jgi:hypothetical protein
VGVQSLAVETWIEGALVGVGVAVVDGEPPFAVAPVTSVADVVHAVKPIAIPVRDNAICHHLLRTPPPSQGSAPLVLSLPPDDRSGGRARVSTGSAALA